MHSKAFAHNPGKYLGGEEFADYLAFTAGGAEDGVEQNGGYFAVPDGVLGARVIFLFEAVLADGDTFTLASNVQDAADISGTGVADYGEADEDLDSAVQATGGTGGSTEQGVVGFDIDLVGCRGFLRVQHTSTLSAAGVDTLALSILVIWGPGEQLTP